jgi:hypothetical protein
MGVEGYDAFQHERGASTIDGLPAFAQDAALAEERP